MIPYDRHQSTAGTIWFPMTMLGSYGGILFAQAQPAGILSIVAASIGCLCMVVKVYQVKQTARITVDAVCADKQARINELIGENFSLRSQLAESKAERSYQKSLIDLCHQACPSPSCPAKLAKEAP